jgi:hypothetical protein
MAARLNCPKVQFPVRGAVEDDQFFDWWFARAPRFSIGIGAR